MRAEGQEVPAGEPAPHRLYWYQSLYGKTALFLISAIVLAYCFGAMAGWFMLQRNSETQWQRQAEMNAQIASTTIRTIYTFIAVETDTSGQILRIISERPLGDDQSVLDTGFNPADVLALAAAQTKEEIWLFERAAVGEFVSLTDATTGQAGEILHWPDAGKGEGFYVGFAIIGKVRHYIASLPVVTADGKQLGLVVASIGRADDLLKNQRQLLVSSLAVLVAVLLGAGLFVSLLLRKVFRPIPSLIAAVTRIAHDDTSATTPFQNRRDEIGRFAVAIERLRAAVVERETLRQVKETAKQLEHLAHHDSLTGLPNRAYFNKRLDEAVKAVSEEGRHFNLLLIDLDRFKVINDSLGHAIGDALLVAAAERISLVLGAHDFPARLGGDEFAIIQPIDDNPMLKGSKLCKALVRAMSTPFHILGHDISISASIGIGRTSRFTSAASELLKNADIALYNAKSSGRGTFRFYKDGMVMAGANRYALERDLELAVERGEFELHYQPIINCLDGQLAGYEALIRWQHPQLGQIPPANFIPLAEDSGQIGRIGQWVFEQACRDAARLPRHLIIAVNVSAAQLCQGNFVEIVRTALAENGVPAAQIELELTESMSLSDSGAQEVIGKLHAMGLSIALDDFGTGHSTLVNLVQLPVDRIKIDRSFVMDLTTSAESKAMVASIVDMAARLGISTTAEGIENEAQYSYLRKAGCAFVQGYHLGRPKPLFLGSKSGDRPRIVPTAIGA